MATTDKLYHLIDRLMIVSDIRHPNRKWTNAFYYECAFQWKDKIPELEQRVLELEASVRGEIPTNI